MRTRAFTLLEVLVTISIIAILAAMALGVYGYASSKAKEGRTNANMQLVVMGLASFKEENDDYPRLGNYPSGSPNGASYYDIGNNRPPGYSYDADEDKPSDSQRISNHHKYRQTSQRLTQALQIDNNYVNYPDEATHQSYDVTSNSTPSDNTYRSMPANADCVGWDLNNDGDFNDADEKYHFGYLDAWGEPLLYLYWGDPDANGNYEEHRPTWDGTTFDADDGFEKAYELYSSGPDMEFGDFNATSVDDADADNIQAGR
jgi:prepilin-type N-terminal cleavage/methylation domain-containing protein